MPISLSHFALIISILFAIKSTAAEFSGTVTDSRNGRPIASVTVRLPTLERETSTDMEGAFQFTELPAGRFVVETGAIGYADYRFEIEFQNPAVNIVRHIELNLIEGLDKIVESPRYVMEEITVTATRASSEHPVTFANLTREQIDESSYGQDLPLLLSDLPNVSVYSEGSSGFGYSYLRMRGFAQDRIAVQVNGIPLNDAETHEVFWVDLPDLAEDLADAQVQRGVGSSLYGPAAFGGTVNLVTRTPGIGDSPGVSIEGMYGSWNTRRAMIQFRSGKVRDRYGFVGRITRMESDGYRHDAWARQWSYYLSGANFSGRHTTRAILYGGPEKAHLAYEGVSRNYLDGRVTGDKEHDRRVNVFSYPGEIDNFFQPHYELHDEFKLTEKSQLHNSLYLFRGDGYYDQLRAQQDPREYFYGPGVPADSSIDLLRRRNVAETDGGWIPRIVTEHRYGTTTLGLESRWHAARHDGQVVWSSWSPSGGSPDYRYYDYGIRKQLYSAYAHNLIQLSRRWRGMLDLQFRRVSLQMAHDQLWHVHFENEYSSVNPRLGLLYDLIRGDLSHGRPQANLYANISLAQREPRPRDVYDPQDYYSLPHHSSNDSRFRTDGEGREYIGPSLDPEKILDIEAGTNWQWSAARLGVNFYHMTLTDAIVPYGALDNLGVPLSINAEETLHRGIEFVADFTPVRHVSLAGNLALTDHHFVKHEEFDWIAGEMVNLGGNKIGFDPQYVGSIRAEFSWHELRAESGLRAVGKQYVDNSQNESTVVPAYSIVSLDCGWKINHPAEQLKAIEPRLRINNLLNSEYESFGYNYGEPLYFVGSPRSYYFTIGLEF